MKRKNKYDKFPTYRKIPVGGVCRLCECNRQIRKEMNPYLKRFDTSVAMIGMFSIRPGMKFSGKNSSGEEEVVEIQTVDISCPEFSKVKRIQ